MPYNGVYRITHVIKSTLSFKIKKSFVNFKKKKLNENIFPILESITWIHDGEQDLGVHYFYEPLFSKTVATGNTS